MRKGIISVSPCTLEKARAIYVRVMYDKFTVEIGDKKDEFFSFQKHWCRFKYTTQIWKYWMRTILPFLPRIFCSQVTFCNWSFICMRFYTVCNRIFEGRFSTRLVSFYTTDNSKMRFLCLFHRSILRPGASISIMVMTHPPIQMGRSQFVKIHSWQISTVGKNIPSRMSIPGDLSFAIASFAMATFFSANINNYIFNCYSEIFL